ncbi:hypothetical protein NLJ89_g7995 [Agrocybe chaxingu]|uniref:Uncharacterized protein n=1 Tax=Agrocybe chaxingu TaxID=84603 RepID=A0A9W8JW79_9AGAR|nr:hypothetical protein NLJ89_g7995 [Agrocybe chaxingu]
MVVDNRPEEHDEDQDSLFGSPPPSPQLTGRPESPVLALPRACPSQGADASRTGPPIGAAASTQNVGTIALPGSQHHSELPINPLALSLNHGVVSRPPAMPQTRVAQNLVGPQASSRRNSAQSDGGPIASTSTSPPPVAAPSALTSMGKRKKRPRLASRTEEESTTPREPEFTLPDPTAPPPVHFLRNQDNLLGKAGRVGGVKPSTLTHTRGSTPSNPILVDDDDTPMIGRRNQLSQSREPSNCQPYIDPSLLTAPTNQEIVQVLIGQKDIFPVLESILKLIMGATPKPRSNSQPPPTGFERRPAQVLSQTNTSSDSGQSVKKRRLNRVPAGAADWDVPYPFEKGEGPTAYEKTWERERGKRLIAELIKLIKAAARKAATKKYFAEQEIGRREMPERLGAGGRPPDTSRRTSYYRPETFTYGSDGKATPTTGTTRQDGNDVLRDASNATHVGKGAGPSADPTQSHVSSQNATNAHSTANSAMSSGMPSTSANSFTLPEFDMSTSSFNLFTTLHDPQAGTSVSQGIDLTDDQPLQQVETAHSLPADHSVPEPFDQNAFDTWMNFLEAFPMPFDPTAGLDFSNMTMTPATITEATPTPSISHCSTPMLDDLPTHSTSDDLAAFLSMLNQSTSQCLPNFNASIDNSLPSLPMNDFDSMSQPLPSIITDHLIDPDLLAISNNNTDSATNIDFRSMMNLCLDRLQAPSPIASTSSFTGSSLDPATPASAAWDTSFPDILIGDGDMNTGGQGMWRNTMWNGFNGMAQMGLFDVGGGRTPMDLDHDPDSFGVLTELPAPEKDMRMPSLPPTSLDKGKGKEVELTPASTPLAPSTVSSAAQKAFRNLLGLQTSDELFSAAPAAPFFPPSSVAASSRLILERGSGSIPSKTEPSLRKVRKDDIIKRAQEKRKQLKEELDSVKRQLWATTVEQAALIHLLRKSDEATGVA